MSALCPSTQLMDPHFHAEVALAPTGEAMVVVVGGECDSLTGITLWVGKSLSVGVTETNRSKLNLRCIHFAVS